MQRDRIRPAGGTAPGDPGDPGGRAGFLRPQIRLCRKPRSVFSRKRLPLLRAARNRAGYSGGGKAGQNLQGRGVRRGRRGEQLLCAVGTVPGRFHGDPLRQPLGGPDESGRGQGRGDRGIAAAVRDRSGRVHGVRRLPERLRHDARMRLQLCDGERPSRTESGLPFRGEIQRRKRRAGKNPGVFPGALILCGDLTFPQFLL